MPPLPGEDRLLTVFTDVHYYFTIPTPKPTYHRFDKGSYLYLYHDAVRGSTRLEIANNPGTKDQDAFNGVLDHVHIVHSTRFPTLCTLTIGAQVEDSPVSAHSPLAAQDQWLLPFLDPRDNSSRRLRLHTLDIYFWTVEDADQFLDAIERHLPPQQFETDRQRSQAAAPQMSAVVEKLENVAITDPSYQNYPTRDSHSERSSTAKDTLNDAASDYTPLSYNPAAPAAPEPIKPREATPPPIDGGDGTGLAAAVAVDEGLYHNQGQMPAGFSQPQGHAVPGLAHYGYSSPPASAGLPPAYMPTSPGFRGPPLTDAPGMQTGGTAFASPPSFAPPPQNPNAHLFPQDSYDTQEAQILPQYTHASQNSQSSSHSAGHDVHEDERVKIGGYSDYTYNQTLQSYPGGVTNEYDIHNQVYRPTQLEAKSSSVKHAKKAMANPNSRHHRLEASAEKVENKVNGFLKRIEKRIG